MCLLFKEVSEPRQQGVAAVAADGVGVDTALIVASTTRAAFPAIALDVAVLRAVACLKIL